MASIQSLGVGSGLLTSELVEDIISAEREATDLRLEARRADINSRVSAFGTVRGAVDRLRDAVRDLGDSEQLLGNRVTSSNESFVTASAQASAQPGIHSVEVLALARNHTLVSQAYDDISSPIGDGSLEIRIGTTEFSDGAYSGFTENPDGAGGSIDIAAENSSLTGIRDAINAAGIDATASIVNDGQGFRLVVTASNTGADHSLEIVATEGAEPGLAAFAFSAGAATPGTNLTQTVVGEDAVLTVDGITVTRSSNTIDEVIEGVTLSVNALNPGAPVTLSVARDNGAIADQMGQFVDAYNELRTLTDELTAFDDESGFGALLMGDSAIRGLRRQLSTLLTNNVSGISSNSLRSLVDLGLTTDQNNNFLLRLDSGSLSSALNASPEDVRALLADQRRASDDLVRLNTFSRETVAGTYDVDVERVASRGRLQGLSGISGNLTIDADNDLLRLTVDGVASADVLLEQGTYTESELAIELQNQINGDATLRAAGVSVEVAYDADEQRFDIRSNAFGAGSSVVVNALDTATETTLGLSADSGQSVRGEDIAGFINGVRALGSGQFLTLPGGPQAASGGVYEGDAVADAQALISVADGANDFVVAVDGTTSATLTIAAGDYTGAELASALAAAVNDDAAISANRLEVSGQFNPQTGVLSLTSESTGPRSAVDLISVAQALADDAGLVTRAGEPGRAAADSSDDAAGIQIQVLGGAAGPRGSVTLVRGAMNQLDRFLDGLVADGGSLDTRLAGLDDQLAEIEREATDFDRRMDALEDRLRVQFASADALISQLNNTSEFLDSQLRSLTAAQRDN